MFSSFLISCSEMRRRQGLIGCRKIFALCSGVCSYFFLPITVNTNLARKGHTKKKHDTISRRSHDRLRSYMYSTTNHEEHRRSNLLLLDCQELINANIVDMESKSLKKGSNISIYCSNCNIVNTIHRTVY